MTTMEWIVDCVPGTGGTGRVNPLQYLVTRRDTWIPGWFARLFGHKEPVVTEWKFVGRDLDWLTYPNLGEVGDYLKIALYDVVKADRTRMRLQEALKHSAAK